MTRTIRPVMRMMMVHDRGTDGMTCDWMSRQVVMVVVHGGQSVGWKGRGTRGQAVAVVPESRDGDAGRGIG